MSLFARSLLFVGASSFALAQVALPPGNSAEEADTLHLDDYVVSTHPYARSASEIAQPTNVVAGPKLDQNQSTSLGELLANEVGVSSTYFGPGASRPIIRALGGPRVAVLQNGTDTIDASTLSPDHAVSLDPLLIERVEITRGPAALLQGGSAIGGAVNVVTHRIHTTPPDPGVHGRIEGRIGTGNDERSGGLVLEGSSGRLAWHADAFHRETNDIEIPGYAESAWLRAQEEAEEHEHEDEDEDEDEDEHHDEEEDDDHEEAFGFVSNSFVTSKGGAFGLSWLGDAGYIGIAYQGFDSNYGVPPGAHAHEHDEEEHEEEDDDHHDEDEHEDEEALVSIDLRQRRLDVEGEWRDPAAGWQALRFRASHADYRHTEFEGDEVGTVFTNEGYDLRLDALHDPWGELQGAIGAKLGESDFEAVGAEAFLPPTTTRELAVFGFEEIESGANLWQFGARAEWTDIAVNDGSGRSRDGDALSASAGWVRTLSDDWIVALSLAHTERLPTAQELFADGPHIGTSAYEIGDPDLGTEVSQGIDLTLRRRAGFISGEVTVFANRFDGFIYENPRGTEEDGLAVYAFEQRDAQFHGAEAEAIFHLHEDEHGHIDLTLAGDFVRGRNRTDHHDLPRVTPARGRIALDWVRGALRAGTGMSHAFDQKHVAPGEIPTDSYTLWSAYAGWRWTTGVTTWDLLLKGTNLTDAEARGHTSFLKEVVPLPGRSIHLSLRLSF
ncbi:TonB-dependent receptor [Synoicihabitans lomoniglobus]|uniref:TonB-dependent receptor n=1 Tax=Synoicihabitans lomoniglobus TaxID=2909285 RepID=A0AAF0CNS7_9BACT|nr:TonB-dependent receptor [Opitutaceae bacterium LMO-M01]WED64971.1 TonB-dependent receptor [Opitutaceae bacterium LMO-M01]